MFRSYRQKDNKEYRQEKEGREKISMCTEAQMRDKRCRRGKRLNNFG